MPNPFAHVELNTGDVKKAKKFYQTVFAWKLTDLPDLGYTMIDVGGGVGGGIQTNQTPDAPTSWLPYVKVDDIKAVMAKAVKAGAIAAVPYQEIGNMGAIGIFKDPAGAMLGLWEESKAPPAAPPPATKKASAASKNKAPAPEAIKKPSAKSAAAAPPAPAPAAASGKKASKKAAPPPPPAPSAKKSPAKKGAQAAPPPSPAKKAASKKK